MDKNANKDRSIISLVGDIVSPSKNVYFEYQFPRFVLGNLEAPISFGSENSKRSKAGPTLCSYRSPEIPRGSVVSLANNHMMDYGFEGISKTQDILEKNGIAYAGAGKTLEVANKAYVFFVNGLKIGILARCEKQFGIAGLETPGVAPLDSIIYKEIAQLKNNVDIVIVSVHGGAEMCPWPSPQMQDLLRSFIDAGALIVHGHHAHVPQGYEKYMRGYIFYGMGNFLVDPDDWKSQSNALWSLVAHIHFREKDIDALEVETVVIDDHKDKIILRKSNVIENRKHQEFVAVNNEVLKNRKLLTGLWQESSLRMYHLWNAQWLGFEKKNFIGQIKEIVRKLSKDEKKRNMLLRYHLFSCETHRDAIMTALGVLSGELEDLRSDETKELTDRMMPWSVKGGRS